MAFFINKMEELNRFSKTITQDESQPASQAMLYAVGLEEEDMAKAQVGIVSTVTKVILVICILMV